MRIGDECHGSAFAVPALRVLVVLTADLTAGPPDSPGRVGGRTRDEDCKLASIVVTSPSFTTVPAAETVSTGTLLEHAGSKIRGRPQQTLAGIPAGQEPGRPPAGTWRPPRARLTRERPQVRNLSSPPCRSAGQRGAALAAAHPSASSSSSGTSVGHAVSARRSSSALATLSCSSGIRCP